MQVTNPILPLSFLCPLREMADYISSKGFYVVAPDFFHGDPVSETLTPEKRTAWMKQHAPVRIPGGGGGGRVGCRAEGVGEGAVSFSESVDSKAVEQLGTEKQAGAGRSGQKLAEAGKIWRK